MPGSHSRQNAELPAMEFDYPAATSCLPLQTAPVNKYAHIMLGNPNSYVRMREDAAWQRSSLPHLHHESIAQLTPAIKDVPNRCTVYFNRDSHSPTTPLTDSPRSASAAHGSNGFQGQSPSMPAHSLGGSVHFNSNSAAAPLKSDIASMQGPGPFARLLSCSVPSGLSSDSAVTQAGQHSRGSPTSSIAAQPDSPNQDQIGGHPMYSASLMSAHSRKRKVHVAETPESNQDLIDTNITKAFYVGGVPAAAAHSLLPNLGTPGMQPVQQVSAAEQMYCTPNSQPCAGSAIDSSADEVPPFKRQRLSRSSGSWGSSSSAQIFHSSYFVPTPGQACDPHGLDEAKAPARGNGLYASSATSQLYYMGQVPVPMQTSPGPIITPEAQFQAELYAWPQMASQLPSQAAPLEAPMASTQAPSQTPPQAPASKQGAVLQAEQVVWARWSGGWWPATVTAVVPPDQCAFGYTAHQHCTTHAVFTDQCASGMPVLKHWQRRGTGTGCIHAIFYSSAASLAAVLSCGPIKCLLSMSQHENCYRHNQSFALPHCLPGSM